MPDVSFISQVLVFLIAAVVIAPICQRLGVSMVLGYLAAGIAIGPHALGLIENTKTTHGIAELGVLFLLFAIGLELSIERLRVIRHYILGLGTAQVLILGVLIGAIAVAAGQSFAAAIVIGGALALSSTAIVLQLLSEQGQLATRAGRVAFSILLLQDLAVVPLLALVPSLADTGQGLALTVVWTIVKAAFAMAVIFAIGRLVLRPLFRMIAVGRNPDLFAATTLLALLGMSWATSQMGLSLAIGGFMAGLLLAETEYRHQVAAEIAPFRGLLLGLFFMTVGMGVDLTVIADDPLGLVAVAVGLIVLKAFLIAALCRLSRQTIAASLHVGLLLAQGGEFGFILLGAAVLAGVVASGTADLLVAAIAITMAVTPALAALGQHLGKTLRPATGTLDDIRGEADTLQEHVMIAGYGRVGQSVAKTLMAAEIPYVALEFEPTRVAEARAQGLPVFYGDASRPEVLRAAGAERARAAVVIMDNAEAAERTVHLIHQQFPNVRVFARARDNAQRRRLMAAGADGIVHETFEMSLQLGGAVLRSFGAADETVQDIILSHRAEDYALLSDIIHPTGDGAASKKGEDEGRPDDPASKEAKRP